MAFVDFPDTPKGRKERFEYYESDEGIFLIEGWRRQGVTIAAIAEQIGISQQTFQLWRKKSRRIKKACEVSVEACNMKVEKSLFERAVGYDYEEETWELLEGELRLTKVIKKHCPPDIKAIMHWLYNRKSDSWRAVQEPLESTQFVETVGDILVAMKQVAESGVEATVSNEKSIDVKEDPTEVIYEE